MTTAILYSSLEQTVTGLSAPTSLNAGAAVSTVFPVESSCLTRRVAVSSFLSASWTNGQNRTRRSHLLSVKSPIVEAFGSFPPEDLWRLQEVSPFSR